MLTVLHAEDHDDVRKIVTQLIARELDVDVMSLINGRDAFLAWRHSQSPQSDPHFDLIITDLRMPKMSGTELVEKIRETDTKVPIIMFSSYDPGANFRETHNVRWVQKPDINKLMQAIRETLAL